MVLVVDYFFFDGKEEVDGLEPNPEAALIACEAEVDRCPFGLWPFVCPVACFCWLARTAAAFEASTIEELLLNEDIPEPTDETSSKAVLGLTANN